MVKHIIIVGAGLAGINLTFHLLKKGVNVSLLDHPERKATSYQAAGMFNPITGRKAIKTWMADELFSYLHGYYPEIEQKLGGTFFHPKSIIKLCRDYEDQNDLYIKGSDPLYASYLSEGQDRSVTETLKDEFGYFWIHEAGFLDVREFLDASRQFLEQNGILKRTPFDLEALEIEKTSLTYNQTKCDRVVFAEGRYVADNPWFNWLPIVPNKGELIEIKAERLPEKYIINKGFFVIPKGNHRFWVGSTYQNQADEVLTEENKQKLVQKLDATITVPYTITDHWAGIRPTVKDRKPIIGAHPTNAKVLVFNGFGTKGVSLTPYFADVLSHSLTEGRDLPESVDIKRYFRFFNAD